MAKFLKSFVAIGLVTSVLGHAVLQTPQPRVSGDKQVELCGAAVTTALKKDLAGPIEDALAKDDGTYNCNAYQCRGYQYEDNADNVYNYTVGEFISFHVDLVAGHHPGWANLSAVDLATNTIIGDPLITWADWPISGTNDDINFNTTIPESLAEPCSEAGACILQWYWWSDSNSQTYESCLDFYVTA
ncbi:hypothetical protein PFICI_10191 [Pestalotiopsis fici W106-1]|uniref:Chitin-binding type-4 domain-containing protein n=1 Tax=Pestalotiopsis fici (strain W106-1 / CGMCC3.15140) TaxID=1229662 RepID=W3WWE7_PESFW|nr:uncharacterized protein PFICI_10191 [Pestalotiopsis fici W106-1]ETS78129.1 hypothetical protein PFICI_10191 [Pestalotiopsis fici W106-1]